jgi:hypothetical protein
VIVKVLDVYGEPLEVDVDIWLESPGYRRVQYIVRDVDPGTLVRFDTEPTETYLVRVLAPGYRKVSKLVSGTTAEVEIKMPISDKATVECQWPKRLPEIPGLVTDVTLGHEGCVLWQLLEEVERQALLNIWAKLMTTYVGAVPAACFVNQVLRVEADRILCRVAGELVQLLEEDKDFDPVPSRLHDPPHSYAQGLSVKTNDRHGSLQISIFVGEHDTLADIDIDENRGALAHLFDVVEHAMTDTKTSQLEVHQILVAQGIDPGWRPRLA